MKAHSHIIVRWSKHHSDARDSHDASARLSPVKRWSAFLITIPLAVLGLGIAAFFFSAFLALGLIAGSTVGIWMWCVRRRVSTDREPGALEGVYRVVDDTEIIEHTAAGVGEKYPLRR